ncbi:hypothetical protein [Nocardia callitridis]|uniref:hypothetical protein n=1 Tax=Nocardia callitridis TaxID=648753 RepID=UPI0031E9AE8A
MASVARSRKPKPGAVEYNSLAAADDAAAGADHFETGLDAVLDGFAHHSDS